MYDEDEINKKIEQWHTNASILMPLHEYLGMTLEEYAAWVTNHSEITAKIINGRLIIQSCSSSGSDKLDKWLNENKRHLSRYLDIDIFAYDTTPPASAETRTE